MARSRRALRGEIPEVAVTRDIVTPIANTWTAAPHTAFLVLNILVSLFTAF
jgi:hypothetical protein